MHIASARSYADHCKEKHETHKNHATIFIVQGARVGFFPSELEQRAMGICVL